MRALIQSSPVQTPLTRTRALVTLPVVIAACALPVDLRYLGGYQKHHLLNRTDHLYHSKHRRGDYQRLKQEKHGARFSRDLSEGLRAVSLWKKVEYREDHLRKSLPWVSALFRCRPRPRTVWKRSRIDSPNLKVVRLSKKMSWAGDSALTLSIDHLRSTSNARLVITHWWRIRQMAVITIYNQVSYQTELLSS